MLIEAKLHGSIKLRLKVNDSVDAPASAVTVKVII